MLKIARSLVAAGALAVAAVAHQAAYPERPITLVVPYAAGGAAYEWKEDAKWGEVFRKGGIKLD